MISQEEESKEQINTQPQQNEQNTQQQENKLEILKPLPKDILIQELKFRKFLNEKRWSCISKPQYLYNCGINSVNACWNYLFSTIGHGNQPPMSQEEALLIIGYGQKPFYSQGFNPGNPVLIRWFNTLCKKRGVEGHAAIFWKKNGGGVTKFGDREALQRVKRALQDPNTALIYHCDNHYMVPIGYEQSPKNPKYTYTKQLKDIPDNEIETHLIVGDAAMLPNHPPFTIANFDNVTQDISQQYPYFYNIKQGKRYVKEKHKTSLHPGGEEYKGNRHCFIACYRKGGGGGPVSQQQQNQLQQQIGNVANNCKVQ